MPPLSKSNRKFRKLPAISDGEWRVMQVVWDCAPASVNQVARQLQPETGWKPKTVQTLLTRLTRKGVLDFEKQGREYLFHPLYSKEQYEHEAARRFLDKVFDGQLAPFLSTFVKREKLSKRELDRLRAILDESS